MTHHAYLMIVAAVALDLLAGDPPHVPHPVRGVGWLLDGLERAARRFPGHLRLAGVVCVAVAAGASGGAAFGLAALPVVGWACALYLAYAGLALGCLRRECGHVAALLEADDLTGARAGLAMLVSRDTSALDRDGVARALAETLAENFTDGFVAPLFWLVVGGPAGMWAYKAVSTMDSMWGYKTDTWRALGWAGARCDDALAWIPARLAACALLCAGWTLGVRVPGGLGAVAAHARRMESPNAGWSMAAAAWLCGAAMGGPAVYFGQVKHKPVLGASGGGVWDGPRLALLDTLVLRAGVGCALLLPLPLVWLVP
ncbi:MAG: adenosylcobinamide-phosphate synthase CbiB [Desulfovibrionaceae bacterium]